MITFNRNGRLGNFMFQVAACYAYSKRHGMGYCVNPGDYLDIFPHLPVGELPKGTYQYSDPKPHRYAEIPYHKDIILEGFWQSYRYFEDCHADICDLFLFPNETIKGAVGIHVRRGDYLVHYKAFPPCNMTFFNQAIAAFTDNGINRFIVFSDDIPWCKANFSKIPGAQFEYSEGLTPIQDMHKLASCEHNIISNSSFSLFAALGNRNPNKIVISPSAEFNWFGAATGLYTLDMLPPEFIQIKF